MLVARALPEPKIPCRIIWRISHSGHQESRPEIKSGQVKTMKGSAGLRRILEKENDDRASN
jgi:hypothetical protein